jgi:hypothetical protein
VVNGRLAVQFLVDRTIDQVDAEGQSAAEHRPAEGLPAWQRAKVADEVGRERSEPHVGGRLDLRRVLAQLSGGL